MVATVTAITSSSSTVHYFEKDGYYAKNDPEHRRASRWRGRGAKELGLRGQVDPRRFARILQGYVPGTDLRLGRVRDGEHQHRPGVDVTFSAPKSVSLQALLRGDEAAMRAHDEAVAATLEFIEARLLETRVYDPKTRRRNRAGSPSLVAATFRHVASRNLDPQLHTHCVIANMTRGPDGKWRSVEASSLHRNARLIGAHYRNELAKRLRDRGYALTPAMVGKVPGFEIAGYGKSTLDAFSSRRREVLDYIRKKGWTYNATRAQAATLATRRRKAEPRREELEALWRQRARDLGIATGGWRKRPGRTRIGPSALEIVSRAAEHLEERTSVFAANELTALALAHSPGRHGIEDVDAAVDRLRRDGHLIAAGRSRTGPAFVTDRAVRAGKEVAARMKKAIGAAAPLASERAVEERLTGLAAGQKDAVRAILLSADRVVGGAGLRGRRQDGDAAPCHRPRRRPPGPRPRAVGERRPHPGARERDPGPDPAVLPLPPPRRRRQRGGPRDPCRPSHGVRGRVAGGRRNVAGEHGAGARPDADCRPSRRRAAGAGRRQEAVAGG